HVLQLAFPPRRSSDLNQFLGIFSVPRIYWTSTEWVALIAIGIVGIWSSLGFNIIILGAGLRSIPSEMYEAARIDGASNWRQLIRSEEHTSELQSREDL